MRAQGAGARRGRSRRAPLERMLGAATRRSAAWACALGAGAAGLWGVSRAAGEAEADGDLFIVKSALSAGEFRRFQVREVLPATHDVVRLRFALPDEHHELGLDVASFVLVRVPVDGELLVRPYTPTSRVHQKGFFDLTVKAYPNGKVSKVLGSLQPGDEVEVKGPISKLKIQRNSKKAIGLVAGGSGITPMLQVIQELLDDPRDNTELRLLYANKAPEDIIYKDRLDALALLHPRFKVYYTVDRVDGPDAASWNGETGFVTKEMLAKALPPPSPDHIVLVCGPPPMLKHIAGDKGDKGAQGPLAGLLKDMKYSDDQVFKF
jgi:cytochrome-b5 reductase